MRLSQRWNKQYACSRPLQPAVNARQPTPRSTCILAAASSSWCQASVLPALQAACPPACRSPYRYGHIVETQIQKDGTPVVEKWYTIGRAAWEMA